MRRFRFTIGGLMGAVAWGALASAVLVAVVRPDSEQAEAHQALLLLPPLGLVVVVDVVRLVRRGPAVAPAGGSAWSLRGFALRLGAVWVSLGLPLVLVMDGRLRFILLGGGMPMLVWLPGAPVLAGLALIWPLRWVDPEHNYLEWPLILVASTLIVLALARLVARGWVGWACVLALLIATLSAVLLDGIIAIRA